MSGYISRRDTDAVVRKLDNMIIGPEHEEEWTEYQEWITQGNIADSPEPLEEYKDPTIQEKLARAGISIDELKEALGV
jgi:hypothetical protein